MRVFTFELCLCALACALAMALLAGGDSVAAGASDPSEPAADGKAAADDSAPPKEPAAGETTVDRPDTAGPANLRFNFRDVPLDTVLDYLSEAAGFTVVRETTVEGRVDI